MLAGRMLNVVPEQSNPLLAMCRAKLLSRQSRNQTALPSKFLDSSLWFGAPPHVSHDLLLPHSGENASLIWLKYKSVFINLDDLSNDLSHLHPVSTPHDIATQGPFAPSLSRSLAEARIRMKYTSNWFIARNNARRMGLSQKNKIVGAHVTRNIQISVFHASQLQSAEALLTIPFGLNGLAINAPQIHEAVQRRVASGCTSPMLFVTEKQVRSMHGIRLLSRAEPVTVTIASTDAQAVRNTHFYNISDVKFSPEVGPSEAARRAEEEHPSVPIDGVTGAQLSVDALVNVPNVARNVWFTAAQLIELRARCGVNAVPVIVTSAADPVNVSYYHVADTEDPSYTLSQVGKP